MVAGGCVLHRKENLVPFDFYPFKGKAFVEDLFRSVSIGSSIGRRWVRKRSLLEDSLPKVDMILCRYCLVHFSYEDVFRALHNICASGSTYLLATLFPGRRRNEDIVTGQYDGAFRDKAPCLWRVDELRSRLVSRLV